MGQVGGDRGEGVALRESPRRYRAVGGVDARRDARGRGGLADAGQGGLELVVDGRIVRVRAADGEAQVGRPDVDAVESGGGADALRRSPDPAGSRSWRRPGRCRVGVRRLRADAQLGAHRPVRADAGRRVASAAATARAASSAVSTSGTITPAAPASSARPIGVGSLASTRTMPTAEPAGVDGGQSGEHAGVAEQPVLERRGARSRSRVGRAIRWTPAQSSTDQ